MLNVELPNGHKDEINYQHSTLNIQLSTFNTQHSTLQKMNFPLFIAKRLYSDQGDKRKVSRPAIHIATAGVAIGLAIMIMSVCVVLGFKHTIRDKVIGFGSHIQVADFTDAAAAKPVSGGHERLDGQRTEKDTWRKTCAEICHERGNPEDGQRFPGRHVQRCRT